MNERAAFSRALRAFFWNEQNFALIAPFEVGWNDGGCLILADAVQMWLHSARPVVVTSDRFGHSVPQHALVMVSDFFVDGDGVSTAATLLKRWREREGLREPAIVMDPDRQLALSMDGIYRDASVSARLAQRLRTRFPTALALLR